MLAEFITNSQTFHPSYNPWHKHCTLSHTESIANDNLAIHEENP